MISKFAVQKYEVNRSVRIRLDLLTWFDAFIYTEFSQRSYGFCKKKKERKTKCDVF